MPAKKNEIYYFVTLNKESLERTLGRKNIPLPQLFQEPQVFKIFKSLSQEEKLKYSRMKQSGHAGKMDCKGVLLSEIEQKKQAELKKQKEMQDNIYSTVNGLFQTNQLDTFTFHIMAASYYVKTAKGVCIPAEISVIKCSFKEGIMDYCTNVVKAELPVGERYEAIQYSELTHNLFDGLHSLGVSVAHVEDDLKEFIKVNGVMQPVYTNERLLLDSEAILDEIDSTSQIKVYSLNLLLQNVLQVIDISPSHFNKSHCENILNNCSLDYNAAIACPLHQKDYEAGMRFCTLSMVRRWFYFICADVHIEENFNVTPKTNTHIAPQDEVCYTSVKVYDDHNLLVHDQDDDFDQESVTLSEQLNKNLDLSSESEFPPLGPRGRTMLRQSTK